MRTFVVGAIVGGAALGAAACETLPFRDRGDLVTDGGVCAEQRFDIYFDEAQASLTAPARDMIALKGEQLRACHIERIQVLGLASATGGSDANRVLSERRAEAVAQAMRAAGWPAPDFAELAAAGDAGATTAGGLAEPLRRRTEVVIQARPR